jgi:hypothetical protein
VHHHQLTFARMAGQHSQDYCLISQHNKTENNPTNKQNLLIFPCAKNTM